MIKRRDKGHETNETETSASTGDLTHMAETRLAAQSTLPLLGRDYPPNSLYARPHRGRLQPPSDQHSQ